MPIEHTSYLQQATSDLLSAIGEDITRDGLVDTPARVAKAWEHWTQGYDQDPAELLKCFEQQNYDEMVVVKDIPLYSKCEHHLADIFGTATVAYVPNGRVVGLSKLSRVVNVFARRLQVQERMTVQIADALYGATVTAPDTAAPEAVAMVEQMGGYTFPFGSSALQPKGVGVLLRCRHMCMESRGICQQGHHTVTSALRGVMTTGQPREEFLRIATS